MQALANKTIVSMYGTPKRGGSLIDEVLYGMPVEILEWYDENGVKVSEGKQAIWCRIRTHYRYEGYVAMADLLVGDCVERFTGTDTRVIMQSYADILSEPKVQGFCLQSITRGGRVRFLEHAVDHEGWELVELVDGTRGYTKEKFLGPCFATMCGDEETFRQCVVDTAKQYLGTQYRWGGKSPLGIDCSGLTSISYMLCGVNIYRDASIEEGFPVHEIPFAEKKPGDLLYFPGHIAMYIGHEQYIHSTGKNGSDGVVINSFDPASPLYRPDLVELLKCTGSIF